MEMILMMFVSIIGILFFGFEIYSMCRSYSKADIAGWKAIIPIWNVLALFRLANLSKWMVILVFIPIVNIYIMYLVYAALADRLGKKRSFGIGLLLFPVLFFPILAFSKEKRQGIDMEEIEDFQNNDLLMDGPIEPLGALPDLEEIYANSNVQNVPMEKISQMEENSSIMQEGISTSYNELAPDATSSNQNLPVPEIIVAPIDPVVSLPIENPMGAMAKVQYIEEEKEKIPSLDDFKICPNCGTKLEVSASTCFLCGKRLDEQE